MNFSEKTKSIEDALRLGMETIEALASDLAESKAEIARLEVDTQRLLDAMNAVGLTPEQKSFVERHLEASRPSQAQPTPSKQEKM